ncbi:hypothetical protein HN51_038639 [Arachis hypogaea]
MSSSHYTKNRRNVMLKITSSQTASSPDSNASGRERFPRQICSLFRLTVVLKPRLLLQILPKEVELVDLIYRQRVSCAFVRMEIPLLIAKIIMLHSTIRGHI